MTVFSASKVEKALIENGFIKETGDYNYFRLYVNGKRTNIRTKTSHNRQEIGDGLIAQMAKQLHLSNRDFVRFVNGEYQRLNILIC